MPSKDQILEALKVVIDPELRRSIVELGMVRSIDVKDGGVVDVTVSLTTAGCPIRNHFQTAVAKAVQGLGVPKVSVAFDAADGSGDGGLEVVLDRAAGGRERDGDVDDPAVADLDRPHHLQLDDVAPQLRVDHGLQGFEDLVARRHLLHDARR